MERVFITHASVDKSLAERLVKLLRRGTGLTRAQVFCSSVEGFGVPTGEQFIDYIKRQLQDTKLAVILLTPAYLDSRFCMWELGALWLNDEVEKFPIIVTGIEHGQLQGPLANVQCSELNEAGLNALFDSVTRIFGFTRESLEWEEWSSERNSFLADMRSIIDDLNVRYHELPSQKLLRASRFSDAMGDVHIAFHKLRDAAFLSLAQPQAPHTKDDLHEFVDDIKAAINALQRAFSTVTGVECRICVKQVEIPPVKGKGHRLIYVGDFLRSGDAPLRRGPNDLDLVHENTDFSVIVQGDTNFFFCNDLLELAEHGDYHNSHGAPPRLPYSASMVWPIRKWLALTTPLRPARQFNEQQHLIGFLCVDSPTPHVFDKEPDFALGASFADTLYHVWEPWIAEFGLFRPT